MGPGIFGDKKKYDTAFRYCRSKLASYRSEERRKVCVYYVCMCVSVRACVYVYGCVCIVYVVVSICDCAARVYVSLTEVPPSDKWL